MSLDPSVLSGFSCIRARLGRRARLGHWARSSRRSCRGRRAGPSR